LPSRRSVLRTIRVTDSLDQVLTKEARERSVSVNTLANGILTKYCEWDKYQDKTHRVSIPQATVEILFGDASQETLVKAAKETGNRVVEMGLFLFGASGPQTVIQYLELLGKYVGTFRLEEKVVGDVLVMEFYHGMGIQYSQYLSSAIQTALERAGAPRPEIDLANHVVSVKLPLVRHKPLRPANTDLFGQDDISPAQEEEDG